MLNKSLPEQLRRELLFERCTWEGDPQSRLMLTCYPWYMHMSQTCGVSLVDELLSELGEVADCCNPVAAVKNHFSAAIQCSWEESHCPATISFYGWDRFLIEPHELQISCQEVTTVMAIIVASARGRTHAIVKSEETAKVWRLILISCWRFTHGERKTKVFEYVEATVCGSHRRCFPIFLFIYRYIICVWESDIIQACCSSCS